MTELIGDLYSLVSSWTSKFTIDGDSRPPDINHRLIEEHYRGAQLAFINITQWGDELAVGKASEDAAMAAGTEHNIYSTMPYQSKYNLTWLSFSIWSNKTLVECCISKICYLMIRTTVIYTII